jgi:hypothetical protein
MRCWTTRCHKCGRVHDYRCACPPPLPKKEPEKGKCRECGWWLKKKVVDGKEAKVCVHVTCFSQGKPQ